MLLNKLYYLLKPILPWRLRLALRRARAAKRKRAFADVWPIDQAGGAIPPNWPGWPNGKRFAVVLTHDVEGTKGMSRVEALMDLESKYGFRSSFNFVPEGEYRLSTELLHTVQQRGFEVGVHGLEHDGKLYSSKAEFARKAARIKDYLKEWGAVGFRSPLMQHRLRWLHELETEYDASTFDTDPFEPESDGVGTTFPFWVPGPHGAGYVELPYTLVQDFTLFVVLRETDIDIWKRKVDWVAEHGGMVLLNTHPDYMCWNGKPQRDEFPVSYYEEFLRYVQEKYDGAYWPALPREVARFYCNALPAPERNTRKKICMVVHNHYESDNRVRRYAEALARRGDHVDVIAITSSNHALETVTINGVTLHRVLRRKPNQRSKWAYAWGLVRFFWVASLKLTSLHRRYRYDLIHIHNLPDFLAFTAWYPKATGTKLILDIHDIVPEFFASKFETGARHPYVMLLKKVEKASAAFVDHVIVSNHLWQKTLVSRSLPQEKCSVFLNHVDLAIFHRRPRTRTDGPFIIVFPGSFQWHQGLDIAIRAFALLEKKVSNVEFHLYGGGGVAEQDLKRLADELGLNGKVKFCGGLSLDQVANVMANADMGVVPKRSDSFGNEAYSTKIMEFMSQGLPVVVSRTKIDTFYFEENAVRFFAPGNVQAMADAMLEVIQVDALRRSLIAKGYEYVEKNNWNRRKWDYLDLVDSLSTESFEHAPEAPSAVPDKVLSNH